MKHPTPPENLLIGAHTSAAGGAHFALYEAAAIGATTCQLFTSNQKRWIGKLISDEDIKKWQIALDETGVSQIMSHDSYLINLGSPCDEGRHKSRKAFKEELLRCQQLDLAFLNFHPGAALDSSEEACLDTIIESLLELESTLVKGKTRLLIETTAGQGSSVGWRFEHLGYIVDRVHHTIPIGVCIDTCHIFAAGYDIRSSEAWDNTLDQFDNRVGLQHLYALHVNDSMKPLGSRRDRHAPLGEGEIGLDCFKAMMTHPRLREIPKYLETPEGPPPLEKRNLFITSICTLMRHTKIKSITPTHLSKTLTVCGWIRTLRDQKNFAFIELNDGSTLSNLQIIAESTLPSYFELLPTLSTGSAVRITGELVKSPGNKQPWELKAHEITLLGSCPEEYPLQKKRHSFEFLRTIAHLRPRTNTQGAVARVRNALAHATHRFFQERDFLYVHTPIITTSDCEGAGAQFLVTTLNPAKAPLTPTGTVDFTQDFFGKPAYLTVSGQLNGEAFACALSDIYTFGPTFRAENSNTSRHLAEFWMIEPEMAFADLNDNIECAEAYLKYILHYVLAHCPEDLTFFDTFIEKGLVERLQHVASTPFAHLTYTEAIDILEKSGKSFQFPVGWGRDLQSEHERFLAEEYCKKPVVLTDYPAAIKSFYMRDNEDGKTVAAMDVLVPKIGEIIGGSQREERFDQLEKKIHACGLNPYDYAWYLQLREFGSVPHAGFGAGFERLVLFATGMENIRDIIPFPRYPGHAEF